MILSLDRADTVAIDRAARHGNQTALVWLKNLREPYRDRRRSEPAKKRGQNIPKNRCRTRSRLRIKSLLMCSYCVTAALGG